MKTSLFLFLLLLLYSCKTESTEITQLHIITDTPISWEKKKPCRVIISSGNTITEVNGKAKFRGGMSRKYDKHSFALKLAEPVSIGNLPKSEKWILNASYIDKTFMRHKISFDLFREMDSLNKAPLCSYINLYEDSVYRGLFILMERMDEQRLQLTESDTSSFIFKEAPLFRKDSVNLKKQHYQKFPSKPKWQHLEAFRKFILESTDDEFNLKIFSWLDIQNLIDWQLLLYFTNNEV